MTAQSDHTTSNQSPPLVVVSVLNWNTPELTLACLRSLRGLTYTRFRVIVVDNGSCDDSVARIQGEMPDVTIIRSAENVGFAAGHALALQQARQWQADAIWLLNSDAIVEADALTPLVETWKTHGDAIYGGLPLQGRDDGSIVLDFPEKFLAPRSMPMPFRRDRKIPFDECWNKRAPLQVGAVSGSTLFLPLTLVEAHGWMDSAWFMYCEEMDYCYRLRAAGVACYLVPMSQIRHAGSGSQDGKPYVADVIQYYRARNEILLAHRYSGAPVATLIALKKLLRAFATLPTSRRRARYILQGARDGYHGISGKRHAPDAYL